MKNKLGISMVELVVAIGVTILILTGIVGLVINITGAKSKGFDRNKAAELAQIVMEDLINQKRNEPADFWLLDNKNSSDLTGLCGFDIYKCSIDFSNVYDDEDYPNCGVGTTDCANATITVGWSGRDNQTVIFNRFFSKNGD